MCYSSYIPYKLSDCNIYEMNTLFINGRGYIMLTELQKKFFLKLKIPPKENVEFEDLHTILLQLGHVLPYENIDIMEGNMKEFCRGNIEEKLLVKNRGGLCYEINSLLYYFLCDCGFDVYRIAGTLYDSKKENGVLMMAM